MAKIRKTDIEQKKIDDIRKMELAKRRKKSRIRRKMRKASRD